jgi:hypothetical protein
MLQPIKSVSGVNFPNATPCPKISVAISSKPSLNEDDHFIMNFCLGDK